MITGYLEEMGIEYWTGGKNVSQGWIGLQCLYCDDSSNHLGIELSTGRVNCWLCGPHGKVVNLIMDIERCSYPQAKKLLDQWWEGDLETVGQKRLPPSHPAAERVALPPLLKEWPQKYLDYIKSRGHSPRQLINKYKLMPAHRFGDYGFRIIVPFFMDGQMVGFTGMDITGKKESRYKDSAIKDSVIPPHQCLYNIDRVKDSAVIVEGVTDVWRIGDGAVALGTNKINSFQVVQLIEKGVKRAFVLLDADVTEERSMSVAELISSTGTIEVEVGYLEADDPDKMSYIDLLRVQKWVS